MWTWLSAVAVAAAAFAMAGCEPGVVRVDAGDCRVENVTDGDTIRVSCLDAPVRLLLVDAPEVARDGTPGACYGREARDYLRSRLPRGTAVRLEAGVVDRDQFQRYLRYVFLGEELINETLVRQGYATRYRAAEDTRFRGRIASAEDAARAGRLGLWSACP